MSSTGRDHGGIVKSQLRPSTRFFCRRQTSSRRSLYPAQPTTRPTAEGCCPTTLLRCSGTGQDFYRARFLQSTTRPRCGGRANGEETNRAPRLPYPRSRRKFTAECIIGFPFLPLRFFSIFFKIYFPFFFFFFFGAGYDRFIDVIATAFRRFQLLRLHSAFPKGRKERPRALRCIPYEVRPNFLVGAPWPRLLARRGRHNQLWVSSDYFFFNKRAFRTMCLHLNSQLYGEI